jgi:hypothetical protein
MTEACDPPLAFRRILEQRRAALEAGNHVRRERAALKALVKQGQCSLEPHLRPIRLAMASTRLIGMANPRAPVG